MTREPNANHVTYPRSKSYQKGDPLLVVDWITHTPMNYLSRLQQDIFLFTQAISITSYQTHTPVEIRATSCSTTAMLAIHSCKKIPRITVVLGGLNPLCWYKSRVLSCHSVCSIY